MMLGRCTEVKESLKSDLGQRPWTVRIGETLQVKTIKGHAIFLAQFADDTPPFSQLDAISRWAAALGYKGVQIPTWDSRLFDLKRAAERRSYCDEILGTLKSKHDVLPEPAPEPRVL